MNKAQLIEKVAESLGSHPAAKEAVEVVLDVIVREVVAGGRVSITGFGALESVPVARRKRRNPMTGEMVMVKATRRVRFRAGQNFLDLTAGRKKLPKKGSAIKKALKGSVVKAAAKS